MATTLLWPDKVSPGSAARWAALRAHVTSLRFRGTADLTRPHPLLPAYYNDLRQRENFVRSLFDASASDYDRINHIMSLGSGAWYRRKVLRRNEVGAGQR